MSICNVYSTSLTQQRTHDSIALFRTRNRPEIASDVITVKVLEDIIIMPTFGASLVFLAQTVFELIGSPPLK